MDIIFCSRRSKLSRDLSGTEASAPTETDQDVRLLAKKSGFVTLKERVSSLVDQEAKNRRVKEKTLTDERAKRSQLQFANLHELFASKLGGQRGSAPGQNDTTTAGQHHHRRSKIPVMKLSKDDWNVKCWEDRLKLHKRRQQDRETNPIRVAGSRSDILRSKPESQLEVFKGRIDDVALKLEKVREGLPLDEQLHELVTNKRIGGEAKKSSHEWTDLLKQELENEAHNPRQLRRSIANKNQDLKGLKSPLGRPIRKIFEDEDDDDDDDDLDGVQS